MKGSYYNCIALISIRNENDFRTELLFYVECPDEWKSKKLMTYTQMSHWVQTGEVEEFVPLGLKYVVPVRKRASLY